MAYVENEDEENGSPNPNQTVGTSNLSNSPTSTTPQGPQSPVTGSAAVRLAPSSGVGSAIGGGAARSGGESSGGSPQGGTNAGGQFATLNNYVNANAPAAQTLANDVTAPIATQYNNLQSGNANVESNINSQIAANNAPFQDLTNQLTPSNIVSFASNPTNVTQFQNEANAQYTGPTSVESNPQYQTQLANEQEAIASGNNLTQTTEGQNQLLQNVETAVPNNPGVTALNEAILTANPTYENQIETAYQPFQGLVSQLQSYAPGADQAIATAQGNATQNSTSANNAIAADINALNNEITNNYNTANTNYQNVVGNNTAITQTLANGGNNQLTPAQESALGINPTAYNNLLNLISDYQTTYGSNPIGALGNPQFYTPGVAGTAPTVQNVATPQEYNEAAAYNNLIKGLTTSAPTLDINATTANQAGTLVPTTTGSFNTTAATTQAQNDLQNADINNFNNTFGYLASLTGAGGAILNPGTPIMQGYQKGVISPQIAATNMLNLYNQGQLGTINTTAQQALKRLSVQGY